MHVGPLANTKYELSSPAERRGSENVGKISVSRAFSFSRLLIFRYFFNTRYFTGKPAQPCVGVQALPKGAVCEVEVIAAV